MSMATGRQDHHCGRTSSLKSTSNPVAVMARMAKELMKTKRLYDSMFSSGSRIRWTIPGTSRTQASPIPLRTSQVILIERCRRLHQARGATRRRGQEARVSCRRAFQLVALFAGRGRRLPFSVVPYMSGRTVCGRAARPDRRPFLLAGRCGAHARAGAGVLQVAQICGNRRRAEPQRPTRRPTCRRARMPGRDRAWRIDQEITRRHTGLTPAAPARRCRFGRYKITRQVTSAQAGPPQRQARRDRLYPRPAGARGARRRPASGGYPCQKMKKPVSG